MLNLHLRQRILDRMVTPEIEALVARMPKPLGSFGYDAWGYNEESAKIAIAITGWLYKHYFRVEAYGLEHVPAQGRVLIIPNHSGQLPMDGILTGTAIATNEAGPRAPRAMIERFFPTVPWLGNILNSFGAVIGDPLNCVKMLQADEAVIVFPEGIRGSGKLYRDRYQLQRFGNGFVHLAMKQQAPIVPVGIVGCEETMPSVANLKPLARLLGVPYIPVGPLLPLPAKVILNFGEPMHFPDDGASERQITARVDEVKQRIRGLIDKGLSQRKSVFA